MGKIDAMWFFQKLQMGMSIVGGISLALMDNKITVPELIQIINPVIQVVAPDVKISPNDISFEERADGSVAIVLSPYLVDKLAFKV